MKQFTFLIIILSFVALSSNCQEKKSVTKVVSSEDFKKAIDEKHGILIDVRTPEEFAEGHIPGAINIDYNNEGFEAALDSLDKNKQYELYCRSGRRSGEAVLLMEKKGFKDIIHLENGILEWKEKGFAIEK